MFTPGVGGGTGEGRVATGGVCGVGAGRSGGGGSSGMAGRHGNKVWGCRTAGRRQGPAPTARCTPCSPSSIARPLPPAPPQPSTIAPVGRLAPPAWPHGGMVAYANAPCHVVVGAQEALHYEFMQDYRQGVCVWGGVYLCVVDADCACVRAFGDGGGALGGAGGRQGGLLQELKHGAYIREGLSAAFGLQLTRIGMCLPAAAPASQRPMHPHRPPCTGPPPPPPPAPGCT